MTGRERREQLLAVGGEIFATKGFDATSVEEIAARARVSKPVVYEHFGGKEGLYAVIVDREIETLRASLTEAISARAHPRILMERATLALLTYIEDHEAGFLILVRDSPVAQATGTFSALIGDVANQVEGVLGAHLRRGGLDPDTAPMYAQMLVGLVALTGQWWVESRSPEKEVVAAHIVNLSWNGLRGVEPAPTLRLARDADPALER